MYSHVKSYTLQAREHPIRKNNFLLKGCLKCEWTLISIVHILINPSFSCLFLVSIIKFIRFSSNVYFRRHSISYGSQHFMNCPLGSPWPISHKQSFGWVIHFAVLRNFRIVKVVWNVRTRVTFHRLAVLCCTRFSFINWKVFWSTLVIRCIKAFTVSCPQLLSFPLSSLSTATIYVIELTFIAFQSKAFLLPVQKSILSCLLNMLENHRLQIRLWIPVCHLSDLLSYLWHHFVICQEL